MKFLEYLLGCRHKRITFPITEKPERRKSIASLPTGTYIVCIDCGKEFPYDWKQMKVVEAHRHHKDAEAAPPDYSPEPVVLIRKQAA